MKRYLIYIGIVSLLCTFFSCKKGVTPASTSSDSILLVKTIKSTSFNPANNISTSVFETYDYDLINNRTVVSFRDSTSNLEAYTYTETYQYDRQNNLVQFISTNKAAQSKQIDFSYGSDGNISHANVQDLWLSRNVPCDFTTNVVNGQKVITMYDTSVILPYRIDFRPQINKYVFDDNGLVIGRTTYFSFHMDPIYNLKDTQDIRMSYDINKSDTKNTKIWKHTHDEVDNPFVVTVDSTINSREGNFMGLYNTFSHLYGRLYWFSTIGSQQIMGNAMTYIFKIQDYFGPPLASQEFGSAVIFGGNLQYYRNDIIQNIYSADGLLTETILPQDFNGIAGITTIEYTYTRIKK